MFCTLNPLWLRLQCAAALQSLFLTMIVDVV